MLLRQRQTYSPVETLDIDLTIVEDNDFEYSRLHWSQNTTDSNRTIKHQNTTQNTNRPNKFNKIIQSRIFNNKPNLPQSHTFTNAQKPLVVGKAPQDT